MTVYPAYQPIGEAECFIPPVCVSFRSRRRGIFNGGRLADAIPYAIRGADSHEGRTLQLDETHTP